MKNDIIFVSYGEHNANENWNKLVSKFPYAKRVNNIKGIYNAYKLAADYSETNYFFIVDADNVILDNFKFDFNPVDNSIGTYIWQAQNPVNFLTYGYGGIKMYNKAEFRFIDNGSEDKSNQYNFISHYDFPITPKIKFVKEIASITHFNSSPYDAWKAAFRECCKLTTFGDILKLSQKQLENYRSKLDIWCNTGKDKPFGNWVIEGAKDGKDFGHVNKNNILELANINNYNWLTQRFTNKYPYVLT